VGQDRASHLLSGFEGAIDYNGRTVRSNAKGVTALKGELEAAKYSVDFLPEIRSALLNATPKETL
jgi:hypothetical protein